MKTFFKSCFAVILLLSLCLAFVSCDEKDEPEYKTIELTKENYQQYLTANAYYSDCTYELVDNRNGINKYHLCSTIP